MESTAEHHAALTDRLQALEGLVAAVEKRPCNGDSELVEHLTGVAEWLGVLEEWADATKTAAAKAVQAGTPTGITTVPAETLKQIADVSSRLKRLQTAVSASETWQSQASTTLDVVKKVENELHELSSTVG